MPKIKNVCCIVGCNSKEKVSFFRFPCEPELRRALWISFANIGRNDQNYLEPGKASLVCSKHFVAGKPNNNPRDVDYIPSLRQKERKRKASSSPLRAEHPEIEKDMAGQMVSCPHMVFRNLQIDIDVDIFKETVNCGVCNEFRTDLWLCLSKDCFTKVCCVGGDHRLAHQKKNKKHCLFVAVRTMRVWCTICNRYILYGNNRPLVASGKKQKTAPPAKRKQRSDDSVENAEHSDDEPMPSTSAFDDSQYRPCGLTGLQNIGNTCYMNAALQALSNTPQLTQYFLSCGLEAIAAVSGENGSSGSSGSNGQNKQMTLSKAYHRLMQDIWDCKGRSYIAPTGILYGIRNVHPMFRGYHQHDTQEFLRCFMDQLHEELKTVVVEIPPHLRLFECVIPEHDDEDMSDDDNADASVPNGQLSQGHGSAPYGESFIAANDPRPAANEGEAGGASSQSEGDEYETCDSGVSERSSLSEETTSVDTENNRSLSNSPSPLPGKFRNASSNIESPRPTRKKGQDQYRSIISDVFDGKLLSSVQCLTCNRISTRVESFQDLSLPIPNRDHLHMLHQGTVNATLAKCSEQLYSVDPGWLSSFWEWLCSWFWGPAVSLHDCLSAFFSADELKGDNMYSCEKCNKLRNGVKFSKVLQLPEVLCIHLKRFRHDLIYLSKISNHVTFPLEGLDLRPYLHSNCVSQVTLYDLIAVICHHGTTPSNGGHYTCYALNNKSETWYEYDDQCVTRVTSDAVRTSEAYVLFYRKRTATVNQVRNRAYNLMQRVGDNEPMENTYAVSKQWITRFNTFAEPGPIDNTDFLCHHARILPGKETEIHHLTTSLPAPVWDYLYEKYGGGPVCTLDRLVPCDTCTNNNVQPDNLDITISNISRMEMEVKEFSRLEQEVQSLPAGTHMNAIWLRWFVRWNTYVKGNSQEPPGPIDNGQLLKGKPKQANYRQVSKAQWDFLQRIYGGGPEVLVTMQNNQTVIIPATTIHSSSSSGFELSETEVAERTSSGNWSVASSDTSHVVEPTTIVTQAEVHHQRSEAEGDCLASEVQAPAVPKPKGRVTRSRSRKAVSTSLVDIRIDSSQPSTVQATTTDTATPVHPIHSSMPTVAQSGEDNTCEKERIERLGRKRKDRTGTVKEKKGKRGRRKY